MTDPSVETEAPAPGEADLVRRGQRGDLDAFNEIVDLHQRLVYNLCLRTLGHRAAAEDATQETFISAYRNIRSFRGTSFRAWVMRIAANACTDELRRRGRRPALSLDASSETSAEALDLPDPAAGSGATSKRVCCSFRRTSGSP
jgi:RNA polymerase sigma-70 factor, ECF subfamily